MKSKLILVSLYLIIATWSNFSNAALITISGYGSADGQYNVSIISGDSFLDNQALLEAQVWWANQTLANEFATLVGIEFSDPGPFFAWVYNPQTSTVGNRQYFTGVSAFPRTTNATSDRVYAFAEPVNQPVVGVSAPSTFGVLVLSAWFLCVRFKRV